ncbi:2-polyprenyl-6-methoxyphenol hydroxylase-like FAD-dependent oxidoreductase [Sinorhizobium fredii]
MNALDTEVLIVGAGPTGLTLALWLARLGVDIRVIDKSAGARRNVARPCRAGSDARIPPADRRRR